MLHNRAAVELRKLAAERTGGQRLVAQHIENRAAMMGGEGAEHPVLLRADGGRWNI